MKVNNKEKIFNVSIDLFSQFGYNQVSVRQIAGVVGIKESSIYNHYKSKESILDAILDYYISQITDEEMPVEKAGENLEKSIDYFYRQGLELYKFKFSRPEMMKITRIILIEAYHNQKIKEFVTKAIFEGPVKGWIELFEMMKEKKLIIESADSKQLAESFYYYGLFLLARHAVIDYPGDDGEFLNELAVKSEKHFKLILDSVKTGD